MVKLLHIVGDSAFGGDSVVILSLCEMAMSMGWHVDVLATDQPFQYELREAGIGVVDLDVIRREIRPLRDLRGCLELREFLRSTNYTIVHTHTSKAGFVGRASAHYAHIPAVLHTVHGFAFHEESNWLSTRCFAALERLATRWCDHIVTVSEYHRKWARDLAIFDASRSTAIVNGISPARVAPTRSRESMRASLGIGSDEYMVLSTGRLAHQKGLECLLECVPVLTRGLNRRTRVVLAGDGPLRGELEDQVRRMGIGQSVTFLGFRSDVGDLLHASDIVALPSLREGLSISLLEAMAAAKPIVATTIGSNLEVIGDSDCALLVPPMDRQSIVKAILRLANDTDLAFHLGVRARARYLGRFTEDRMVEQYKSLYLNLIESRCSTSEVSYAA